MKSFKIAASVILLSGASALAADLPSIKSAPLATPALTWTGFYAGLNSGGTWSKNSYVSASTWEVYQPAYSADYVSSAFLSHSAIGSSSITAGFIGGGQLGYNWQILDKFLIGIEVDIQGVAGSSVKAFRLVGSRYDDDGVPGTIISNQTFSLNLNYLGTARGRLGYLISQSLSAYGTGGLAYGGISGNGENLQLWSFENAYSDYKYVMGGNTNIASTRVGWSVGGGLEWMFLPNWSAKAEYLYYDLGSVSASIFNNQFGYMAAAGDNFLESITSFSGRINGNIVRAGVNYHFNSASLPVIAKF